MVVDVSVVDVSVVDELSVVCVVVVWTLVSVYSKGTSKKDRLGKCV